MYHFLAQTSLIASHRHTCLLSHLLTFHFLLVFVFFSFSMCGALLLCMVALAFFYAWWHWPCSLTCRDFPTGHLMMLLLSNWFPVFKSTLRCAAFSGEHLLLWPSNWVFKHHYKSSHRTLVYCAGYLWFTPLLIQIDPSPSSYVSDKADLQAILQ